jgi:hypothetical protein
LDSISRMNFERHFPITTDLLAKHNFYTMYGYNKVADNTFVNLTPLLTGHYLKDLWNETLKYNTFLNYFPFIWKEYHKKGYKTLLMEDFPTEATFNYLKIGFKEPPTDYYLRPFSIAIDRERGEKDYCYLDKSETEVYFQYVYDFVRAMDERQQKYFAFTFLGLLSHDLLNEAGLADPLVAHLFEKLFDGNLMSNTILIFFSDHGIRVGPIRETLSGKFEERLPFMHIFLPEVWRNKNLTINENRLTTPFDIHATLTHIIRGEPDYSLKHGLSLFEEIPETRSCADIPIEEHWCSCQTSQPVPQSNLAEMEGMSHFIVQSINNLLESNNYSQLCARLTLNQTISAFEMQFNDKAFRFKFHVNDVIKTKVIFRHFQPNTVHYYLITISVDPSDALLEATVLMREDSQQMQIIGEVSRINSYGNQSVCIDNQFMRRYCFCQ